MRPSCKVLAITAGVLLAFLYVWPSKTGGWGIKEAVLGLVFGGMMVAGMWREPKRVTPALVGFGLAPLMAVLLMVWARAGDLRDPALQIGIVLAFLGVMAAFARLTQADLVGK